MMGRSLGLLLALSLVAAGALPTPREHFGFTPGDDYKLAGYKEVIGYFEKLAAASDRIRLVEYGKTSLGKASYYALISSPENLRDIEKHKAANRRLARGEATSEEARRLSADGKAFVWIDSGLHASEVAPVQHAPELAYRMLTDESDEVRRIREKVILIQVPVINPDGLDMVVNWYRKNVGTPFELAPLPELYQKYAGHDNNRDWFMLNLQETRNVTRLLYEEWFPQILYNQHQTGPFPSRIFVPPYAEPLNPNIPAPVMEGINLIGAAMKERFARENKPGVLSYHGYDAWWNGGLRSVPAFHNMHGILTETALHMYATPKTYKPSDIPARFSNGIPTREPSVFYERPWLGGKWSVRDAIDYMLTADFAILDLASSRSSHFLYKAWELATANIEAGKRGKPYAYVIPADQPDRMASVELLRRLQLGGIRIQRARSAFSAANTRHPEGTFVILAAQPFRGYLVDLLEPHKYPELRSGTTGPTKRPYDVAGWTLSMQMGVNATRIDEPFEADLAPAAADLRYDDSSRDHRDTASFLHIARLLARKETVRWAKDGSVLTNGAAAGAWDLRRPRVGLYTPWTANMDTGWTEWLLDRFEVPYSIVRNDDLRKPDLHQRFDSLIFAAQSPMSILHGFRDGEPTRRDNAPSETPALQRPEFTGGIGIAGLNNLDAFVKAGGTLIAFDDAAGLAVDFFPLPLRPLISSSSTAYYNPGSIVRISVDTSNPLAFGVPENAFAFSSGGQAWNIQLAPEYNKGDRQVRTVARYAADNVLASGWLSGEMTVAGKPILVEANHGRGRAVLFGFRPQFRGQSWGTFKFVLNAIYLASAKRL